MKYIILLFSIAFTVISCKKDPEPEPTLSTFDNGIICMNEGLFQQNNASLSFYSRADNQVTQSVFSTINGRGLGDTANDMISYFFEGKLYIAIAVDVSSQIEIVDAITLKSIKQIPVFDNTSAREPRSLEFYNGQLYSINFDGTVSVIDLSSQSITSSIECGQNPEHSYIINNELYVVNSGGLNSPTYDNTITVISLNTNTVTSTFETAINCSSIEKDTQNELYLISRGNYTDIAPQLLRIDIMTKTVVESFDINIGGMTYYDNTLYYFDNDDQSIHTLNTETESINPAPIIDCSDFQNLYSIQIDNQNDLIYLIDANGYVNSSIVRCYDLTGNYKYEFTSGLNTGKLLFN